MPHEQLDQNAPAALQEEIFARAAALPDVLVGRSHVSVPGARAFHLRPDVARGPTLAFMVATEFAHLHPATDGSLHMALPAPLACEVVSQGWAEVHPIAKMQGLDSPVMVFGPRDEAELEIVWSLLTASYRSARGE